MTLRPPSRHTRSRTCTMPAHRPGELTRCQAILDPLSTQNDLRLGSRHAGGLNLSAHRNGGASACLAVRPGMESAGRVRVHRRIRRIWHAEHFGVEAGFVVGYRCEHGLAGHGGMVGDDVQRDACGRRRRGNGEPCDGRSGSVTEGEAIRPGLLTLHLTTPLACPEGTLQGHARADTVASARRGMPALPGGRAGMPRALSMAGLGVLCAVSLCWAGVPGGT